MNIRDNYFFISAPFPENECNFESPTSCLYEITCKGRETWDLYQWRKGFYYEKSGELWHRQLYIDLICTWGKTIALFWYPEKQYKLSLVQSVVQVLFDFAFNFLRCFSTRPLFFLRSISFSSDVIATVFKNFLSLSFCMTKLAFSWSCFRCARYRFIFSLVVNGILLLLSVNQRENQQLCKLEISATG